MCLLTTSAVPSSQEIYCYMSSPNLCKQTKKGNNEVTDRWWHIAIVSLSKQSTGLSHTTTWPGCISGALHWCLPLSSTSQEFRVHGMQKHVCPVAVTADGE
jgi:hypothetical protein